MLLRTEAISHRPRALPFFVVLFFVCLCSENMVFAVVVEF